MGGERLLVRDAIGSFAPGQALRAALLLTYTFDGKWIEEGFVPDLFDRPIATALLIRDANRVLTEAPTVRYHRANAGFSTRVFHPKLGLFIAEDRALAIVGSANLTRGGLERNLELGSVFEISRGGGQRPLFESILRYIAGPLMNELETGGSAATSLRDVTVALREILADVPPAPESAHTFLHNYERPLWGQILDTLPHRHVARLSIVSPFFEPNAVGSEDPIDEADAGIFKRMFEDLTFEPPKGESPVSVFFQQSEGKTLLPIDKLTRWKDRIALFQRLATTSDEPRPLHGKLLLIEGAKGGRRDPYLVAVYGSPNFTSAAFLSRPPEGNAEIAVLTRLPAKRNPSARARSALGLTHLFGEMTDWSTLTHVAPVGKPPPVTGPDAFRVTDAFLSVGDRKLELLWQGNTTGAMSARVLVETSGAWVVIASGAIGEEKRLVLDVPQLVEMDQDKLSCLKSTHVRVDLLDAEGVVIARSVAPVNVDCPHQFCGAVMVGPAMSTLDEQIAFAGCGVQQTYRQQLDFIERQRSREPDNKAAPYALTHQADLDRFFRNLQTGFRGIRARVRALPNSEFTARRTLRDLARWCQDTVDRKDGRLSVECRMFLVDRLVREIRTTLESCEKSQILAPQVKSIARQFRLAETLTSASEWLRSLRDRRVRSYVADTTRLLTSVSKRIEEAEGR
jgi:hypothetical protein